MKAGVVFLICILIGFTGCEQIDLPSDVPDCVKKLIRDNQTNPQKVWRYRYQKEIDYLVLPDCCDQFISLYTSQCTFICAPSGGFSGNGDGKCPGFYQDAENGELIWERKD